MHLVSDRHLKVWHDPQHSGRLSPGCWQVLCDQSGFVGFCRFLSFFFYDVCQYLVQTKHHFSGVYLTFMNITAHNQSLYCKCLELMLALTKAMHHPSFIIKNRGKPSKSHHMQQCGTISQPPSIVTRTLTCDQLKMQ